jgi:hypothetical protein
MSNRVAPRKLYTARSQTWVGNTLFRPVRLGGNPIEEGDPILQSHPHLFEPYEPRVHPYKKRDEDAVA